jgi:ribosomal protein S18 acetylase RimI-like enzyme
VRGAGITFAQGTASRVSILEHLTACSADHDPPLDSRIDLREYAGKISVNAVTFEAWSASSLVGLVAAYLNGESVRAGYVTNVSVTRDFTGRGIATALMRNCIEEARRRGFVTVALEVAKQETRAFALYYALGFSELEDQGGTILMELALAGNGQKDQMRDFNEEYRDSTERQYAYDFDWVLRKYLLRAISPYLKRGGRALEIGCYKGDMTDQLLAYFDLLTVVEASSELCAIVSKRFPGRIEVINSTFEDLGIKSVFENVFLVHTLEHLDDPVGTLSKVRGWMPPGGRLFVAVPNANALSRQIAVRMGLIEYNSAVTPAEREHGHRITYSMSTFLNDLRSAGLTVICEGGVLVKALANFQFDRALKERIVDERYLDGCYELGRLYPDLCASLYAVCENEGRSLITESEPARVSSALRCSPIFRTAR